ncbi:polysaccharide deacetylase family protein [Parablautia muri]|uniref:Peptidoglycan N-acetylglucosamine deacetylase n=1 Tax=Parablautia muri TaxID=2320879 RepID=A0A9X5GSB6_9FIRM|nr:polysaccharide deacetylase family protein [Parablautia muri]NBJ93084.1 peptidoglycan N-acetylglucosamine deacetylase [Parablautia muri]
MHLKKRILACILLLIMLAALCIYGVARQQIIPTMGKLSEDKDGRKIALTFDDGPHPYYTEQLLKGLKERDAKATFFITGKNVEEYPEIVKKIYEDGHLIGNHTYNHTQLTSKNTESFKEEIIKTNEAIKQVTGEDTIYVRPPYGSWNKEFEKELNMFPVLWTIDPLDWCSNNVSCIVDTVCAKADENEIILMHDQYKSTVTAALKIVDQLQKEGYEFVTVDELLFD